MFSSKLLYLASLITFTFGALGFSVLVWMYFRQRRLRASSGGAVLAAFTAACAAAFVINLALQIASAQAVDSPLLTALTFILGLTTSLLPSLVFHVIYTKEARDLPHRRAWAYVLVGFYAVNLLAALLKGLADIGLIDGGLGDGLSSAPAVSLGVSAALAMTAQFCSRRALKTAASDSARRSSEQNHRRWTQALLASMFAVAALNLAIPVSLASLLADYLLLVFFCVTLYYEERLMFFDILIKRGTFFAAGLVGLTVISMLGFHLAGVQPADQSQLDWTRAWIWALLLAPFWLIAPWTYRRIEHAIDRGWLRRRYSHADAEQRFIRDVQVAATEEDLRARAAASVQDIFQAPARVSFDPRDACDGGEPASGTPIELIAPLEQSLGPGSVRIQPRPDGMPFLSDDRRLLHSLARTLGVVLENVRFREREQELRWLASRAELKALRAQMNPHFLFNALNAIAGLIEEQPRLADETIEQLAHVLRYALRRSENEWVRLDEEIEFVAAYLRVEQARFGERLHVEFGVDHAAAGFPVPAMTIQPLVENAIKHGVSALEGMGTVGVRAVLDGELLCVEVSDNGPGFPPGFSIGEGGHGLRNIAERIAGYYGDCAQLRWESGWESAWESGRDGTRVFLNLPRRSASHPVGEHGSDARFDRG